MVGKKAKHSPLPPRAQRVIVRRRSGQEIIARREYPVYSLWRDKNRLDWLDDDDKFADVGFDPVVAWRAMPLEK